MNNASVVFAGTPEFARASLKALVDRGVKPLAVLTQPDRPAGRGKTVTAGPVKDFAIANGISVWQPATLQDAGVVSALRDLQPDLLIVAAYGLLLPQAILDLPRRGCVNVHASLLPRWRGAAPIQAAILHGDTETGISLMQMEAGLDTGPVFARAARTIDAGITAGELHDCLATLGGALLTEHLRALLAGTLVATPQDKAGMTYAAKIRNADAGIDWSRPATDLHRLIRAYNPVPGARFEYRGEAVKCWHADLADEHHSPAGRILSVDKDSMVVACGDGSLRLTQLQRPGRRRITAGEFASQLDLRGGSLGSAQPAKT